MWLQPLDSAATSNSMMYCCSLSVKLKNAKEERDEMMKEIQSKKDYLDSLQPKLNSILLVRPSSRSPLVKAGQLSLRSTATFIILPIATCCWHFLSTVLRSLFRQYSNLNCCHPPCFVVADLFRNLSSFVLTMCPVHFVRILTILPTVQALLVPTSSPRSVSFSPRSLHRQFSSSS